MISIYTIHHNTIERSTFQPGQVLPENVLWIDVKSATAEEKQWLESISNADLPSEITINEIEISSRQYRNADGLHISSLFPQRFISTKTIKNINISLNLRDNYLITTREDSLSILRLVKHYLRQRKIRRMSPQGLMLELFYLKVEFLSDLIEDIYTELETLGASIYEADELDDVFRDITRLEDATGKIRLSLLDSQRSLRFIQRQAQQQLDSYDQQRLNEMLRDIDSLMPHSQFIFDKINFLMDAAIGFSGLQQNKIIKIFSVAAVIFLPPTVIASIYGMNFKIIPELEWAFGYPMALVLMVLSAWGTYSFFKWRKWL
ncbi:magnesium/cobalt transporter CorA [Pseudidiomarina sediminum]|uniref:magnesium/cobalt transporter CorA n=1 Tax=Pseudidiomarina sediminum TaxID=431675 RepID=UPI003B84A6DC